MTRKLTQGNEAVFRGAIAAGASYYAGYPISPSTEILNIASGWTAEHPEFRFLQAEDEIASAQAVIGASLAGAKSFTSTCGPGSCSRPVTGWRGSSARPLAGVP